MRPMSATRCFVDTNILLYAVDHRHPEKQEIAADLIAELVDSDAGYISLQVVNEFAANLLKKFGRRPEETRSFCEGLADLHLTPFNLGTVGEALGIVGKASISYSDACILAAAKQSGCKILYSEDLSSGQRIAGLKIVNPFSGTGAAKGK